MLTFIHKYHRLWIAEKKMAVKDHYLLESSLVGENSNLFLEHQFWNLLNKDCLQIKVEANSKR